MVEKIFFILIVIITGSITMGVILANLKLKVDIKRSTENINMMKEVNNTLSGLKYVKEGELVADIILLNTMEGGYVDGGNKQRE